MKNFWQSKTFWGAFLFAAASFVANAGIFKPDFVTVFAQFVGFVLGAWGLRDAMQKEPPVIVSLPASSEAIKENGLPP